AGVSLFMVMRYPADIANRPSRRVVVRIEAKCKRGRAHRRAVARSAFPFPSDQSPMGAGGKLAQSLECARAHSGDAPGAMPCGEMFRNRRRINRSGEA